MNRINEHPPKPRTVEEERVVAAAQVGLAESLFSHEVPQERQPGPFVADEPFTQSGNSSMFAVRYPDGHTALVSESNLRGALACGGTVIETPKMSPTVNGAPGPRVHVLG